MIKFTAAKKRLTRVSMAVLVLAFVLSPAVYADTFPYLKAFGGDTWTGGWFENSGTCTPSGLYQDPANNGGDNNIGGILTYANAGGGGSSDEFGALSLGVMSNSGTNGGFYTNGYSLAKSTSLSFASPGIADGGLFEGAAPPLAHCVPDYYDSNVVGAGGGWTIDNYNAPGGKFTIPSGSVLNGGPVKPNTKLTVFVNGNVYITGDITYAAGYNETNVPKFALVVKGNIFIEQGVHQLDGVYIAQPSSGNTDGTIWTCHDGGSTNSLDGPWTLANCNSKLTVNGSLIAKQVNYTRIPGDVGPASASETSGANNAAEVINYTPSMVIGGPFFNPQPSSNLKIDSLVSLPPLF
jgi:hypothetical protein